MGLRHKGASSQQSHANPHNYRKNTNPLVCSALTKCCSRACLSSQAAETVFHPNHPQPTKDKYTANNRPRDANQKRSRINLSNTASSTMVLQPHGCVLLRCCKSASRTCHLPLLLTIFLSIRHSNSVRIVPHRIPRNSRGSVNKSCSEEHVRVVEHSLLQRDDDEL